MEFEKVRVNSPGYRKQFGTSVGFVFKSKQTHIVRMVYPTVKQLERVDFLNARFVRVDRLKPFISSIYNDRGF